MTDFRPVMSLSFFCLAFFMFAFRFPASKPEADMYYGV